MTNRSILGALLLLIPTLAAGDDGPDAAAYRQAYAHVLDGAWQPAVAGFEALIAAHPESPWADDAGFWRCYAREQLGGEPAAHFDCYEALVERHPRSEWRDDARRALVGLARDLAREGAPEYRERLRALEGGGDDDDLIRVLIALGEIGDERSLDAIFERIDRIEDPGRRAQIVSVLEEVESPRAVDRLVALARSDPAYEVRATALAVLGERDEPRIGGFLREMAADERQPPEIRAAAVHGLAERSNGDTVELLRALALELGDGAAGHAAVHALGERDDAPALAALETILAEASTPETRRVALHAIAEHDSPAALELLHRTAIAERETEIGPIAVRMIGEREDEASFALLRELAGSELGWRMRAAAVATLGEYETDDAVEALASLARDADDPRLRRAAIHALAETGRDAAVPMLLALAKDDPDPDIRRAAVEALGDVETDAAREALIDILQTGDNR